jgi:hypothetical protein
MISENIYNYIKFNISDVNCYLYNRPTNSNKTDLVVSVNNDICSVEIFANNKGTDVTFPNFDEYERVLNQLDQIIPYDVNRGEWKRNSNGYWSVLLQFSAFMYGIGQKVERIGLSDGYGGNSTTFESEDCQVFIKDWKLENNRVDVIIDKPFTKNTTILFNDDEFVIDNFKPINDKFNLCLTYRKSPMML